MKIDLTIIKNPNKWVISEPVKSLTDIDSTIGDVADRLIERNLEAWRILSDS